MAFNPGVYDRSGEILANSISRLGNNVADTMRNVQKAEAEKEVILGQLKARHDAGMITPEDYTAALQGNMNKARSLITQSDAAMLLEQRQQQMDIAKRNMALSENELGFKVNRANALGQIVQGQLSDGTVVDINAGTGQVVGGARRNRQPPDGQNVRWIQDPTTQRNVGYQVWDGSGYGEPRNVPAPNPMETMMANQAQGGAPIGAQAKSKADQLREERAMHVGKIAGNDKQFGLANIYSRENRIKEIDAELADLEQGATVAKVSMQPNAPAPQSGPARISSKAEYDALPSGAEYINAKTGTVFRKP